MAETQYSVASELAELRKKCDRLTAALKAVEWGRENVATISGCRVCGMPRNFKHAIDCIVGLALKGDSNG